jgi:large subunit ribosomal protein L4
MMVDIYNAENKKTGEMDLPDNVFNVPWRPNLVHQVVVALQANRRRPWAHTKGRGEVRGGGKKPWPQKGTGQARHGSIRSPLWKGGGVTHGPLKSRRYEKKINKEMKKQALFSVLSKKLADEELKIVDDLNLKESRTKILNGILRNFFGEGKSVLVVPKTGNRAVYLAGRNIPKTTVGNPRALNVYDCLAHKYVVFEKDAIADFTGAFQKTK